MAQSWLLVADAVNQNNAFASVTVNTAKITLPAGPVRAHTAVGKVIHTKTENPFSADCFISSFNKGGITHDNQHLYHLIDTGITEISVTTTVSGCEATGLCVIDAV